MVEDQSKLQVGSLVTAKRTTGICDAGERGVCYECYTFGNRPGWSIIFESGRYDGFSPEEVDMMLTINNGVCPDINSYEFKNVLNLMDDFRHGRFAAAFKVHR